MTASQATNARTFLEMRNFSRPRTAPHQPALDSFSGALHTPRMVSRPILRRSSASRMDSTEAGMRDFVLDNLSRPVPDLAATLRKALDIPVWEGAEYTNASQGQASGSRRPRYKSNLPSPMEDVEQMSFPHLTSSSAEPVPHSQSNKARYYSYALSDQDKHALAMGEKNDNLKEWAPSDLVQYQNSRIELVPYCENRLEILTAIAQDKRSSEQFLLQVKNTKQLLLQLFGGKDVQITLDKQVRQSERLPLIKVSPSRVGNIATYNEIQTEKRASRSPDATKSMIDLRLPSSAIPMPPSLPSGVVQRPVSSNLGGESLSRHARVRPSSNGDYFAGRHGRHSSFQSGNSTLFTNTPNRVRSPLAAYEHKADITFDAFLAPHKSGKGETFRDTERTEVASRELCLGRLSNMSSMPNMRKRLSKLPSRSPLDG